MTKRPSQRTWPWWAAGALLVLGIALWWISGSIGMAAMETTGSTGPAMIGFLAGAGMGWAGFFALLYLIGDRLALRH